MSIKWKSSPRFKPQLVLDRIAAARTRNPEGKGASFSGWQLHNCLPLLHSMLEFPSVARDIDRENLIWRAAAYDPGELTAGSFLKELNKQLSAVFAHRNQTFHVLTAISIEGGLSCGTCTIENKQIQFCGATYPRKYLRHRSDQIQARKIPSTEGPQNYTRVVVTLEAKSPALAIAAALQAVDLQRALWCLCCNC